VLGAALSVVGIGVLLYWIAWIFSASGFHALKPAANQTNYYQTQQYFSQSMGQKKFCPHCGAENKADSIYCSSCGKPLM
jgi:hypothetical protein